MTRGFAIRVSCLSLLFVALTFCGGMCGEALGTVTVAVDDAGTAAPIRAARVTILGSASLSSRFAVAGADGAAAFIGLAEGSYELVVQAPNYEAYRYRFEVRAGEHIRIAVKLLAIHTIGRTTSKAVAGASRTIDATSPQARISPSLIDALSELSGVDVRYANGRATGISLDGRDPSLTDYAFNGVSTGNPLASRAFDPNLVDGIQVDQSTEQVNFLSLNPTLTPTFSTRNSVGGYGFYSARATAQGTAGSVGYAAIVSARGTRAQLDGSTYGDTTGTSYIHHGGSHGGGFYFATAAQVGASTTVSLRGSDSVQRGIPLPDVLEGTVPLGYGPGASSLGRAENYSATVSAALPNGLLQLTISHARERSYTNEPSQQVFGVPEREASAYIYGGTLFNLDGTVMAGHAPAHFDLVYDRDGAISTQSVLGTSMVSSYMLTIGRAEVDRVMAKIGATPIPAYASFAFAGPNGGLGLRIVPVFSDDARHLTGHVGVGTSVDAQVRSAGGYFGTPSDAVYDCAAHTIVVQGPSDPPEVVRNTGLDAALNKSFSKGSISVSAFEKKYDNISLTDALTPASAFASSSLPPNYIASFQADYSRLAQCVGLPPSADAIFVRHTVSGLSVRYGAVDLTAQFVMSPAFRVAGFYDANSADLIRAPKILTAGDSPYIVGTQLPNAPLHRAGATVEWMAPHAKLQMLANWTYVAVNNQNNLPGFSIVSLALERELSRTARIDVVASNVGRSYQALFESMRFAVPLRANGGPLLLDATPLAPPQIFVTINARSGPE